MRSEKAECKAHGIALNLHTRRKIETLIYRIFLQNI